MVLYLSADASFDVKKNNEGLLNIIVKEILDRSNIYLLTQARFLVATQLMWPAALRRVPTELPLSTYLWILEEWISELANGLCFV